MDKLFFNIQVVSVSTFPFPIKVDMPTELKKIPSSNTGATYLVDMEPRLLYHKEGKRYSLYNENIWMILNTYEKDRNISWFTLNGPQNVQNKFSNTRKLIKFVNDNVNEMYFNNSSTILSEVQQELPEYKSLQLDMKYNSNVSTVNNKTNYLEPCDIATKYDSISELEGTVLVATIFAVKALDSIDRLINKSKLKKGQSPSIITSTIE